MGVEQRKFNTPPRPVRPSATERHELDRITPSTRVKPKNSVTLPGIDTRAEIEQIGQGLGQRVGDSRYRINGRVYVQKPDGAMYPQSGEGIVQLTRLQFRALRLLIEYSGRSAGFDRETRQDPDITDDDIVRALEMYRIREST